MIGHYKRSKFLAEQAVARGGGSPARRWSSSIPSTPVGPGDVKPTPTGQLVLDAAAGRMPAYVDTGLNIVHVDDVAAGHLLAFHRGRVGERYILGGEDMTLRQILGALHNWSAVTLRAMRAAVCGHTAGRLPCRGIARATGRSGRTNHAGGV